jgi:hypothetical protein
MSHPRRLLDYSAGELIIRYNKFGKVSRAFGLIFEGPGKVSKVVIASEAKQSDLSFCCTMEFASLANDGAMLGRTCAFSPRAAPEVLKNFRPKEGVGNAGCPVHPQPRVRSG